MGISMAAVVVLVVAGLVFLSVFATEYIFAAARHGKRVLKRELRSRGVDPERLGDECLDALVAQCVDTPRAEDRNEGRKFWRAFKAALRVNAGKVAAVLEGPRATRRGRPATRAPEKGRSAAVGRQPATQDKGGGVKPAAFILLLSLDTGR